MDTITKQILQYLLNPSDTALSDLKTLIKSQKHFYLVAASQTTLEEWTKRQFAVFIDAQKQLPAFLFQDDAIGFAANHHCTLDDKSMVTKVSQQTFSHLVAKYKQNNLLNNIKVYGKVPIGIIFDLSEFPCTGQTPEAEIKPEASAAAKRIQGVAEVKKALDTFETNARKKLDPGKLYENFATLVQTLVQQNNIDPSAMDKEINAPAGYTKNLFANIHTTAPSKDLVLRYLSYFGLSEYLYLYAPNCPQIREELKSHKIIDKEKLKASPPLGVERYTLENIERGKNSDGFYIYRLTIRSKETSKEIVVSNPLNLQIGREYQLVDQYGDTRKEDLKPKKQSDAMDVPSEKEMAEWVKEAERREKNGSREPVERTYEEKRKDAIISFFRRTQRNINVKSAEAKYKALEVEADILDAFYKFITNEKTSPIEVEGYTAKRLKKETYLSDYEIYTTLIRLRHDPKGTIQWLHDPQNRRPSKGEGGGHK